MSIPPLSALLDVRVPVVELEAPRLGVFLALEFGFSTSFVVDLLTEMLPSVPSTEADRLHAAMSHP